MISKPGPEPLKLDLSRSASLSEGGDQAVKSVQKCLQCDRDLGLYLGLEPASSRRWIDILAGSILLTI